MQTDFHQSSRQTTEPVRLCLLATVDNFHLASLLNPLLEREQFRICLDASHVSRLGTVEFRVLGVFAEACKRRGGFLKLEHASASVAALVREFGFTELLGLGPFHLHTSAALDAKSAQSRQRPAPAKPG